MLSIPKTKTYQYKINISKYGKIKKHIVFIPKSIKYKHYYSHDDTIDDLTRATTPTNRSGNTEQLNKTGILKFNSIVHPTSKTHIKNMRNCSAGYIPCVYLKGSYN